MQTLVDSLTKFISEHTEFSQDVFVAILGVVIGSILTALINTRATRTQAKFNMEHELLKEYHKKVQQFCRDIEEIEISLAQVKWETAELSGKIYALDTALVQFTIRLQEERKFVRKHLSAKSVQKFIDGVTLFHSGLFVPAMDTNSGLPSFDLLKKIDTEHVRILRCAEKEIQKVRIKSKSVPLCKTICLLPPRNSSTTSVCRSPKWPKVSDSNILSISCVSSSCAPA